MLKNELRTAFADRLKKTENKESKSLIIAQYLFDKNFYNAAGTVALYCSTPGEVDTRRIIKKCLADGKKVVLPKVTGKGTMIFCLIDSVDDISVIGKFGISEPAENCEEIGSENLDLIVVPGVCFDLSKSRIGRGGGYYDRYLAECDSAIKVGICFDSQILKCSYIPCEKTDIKMDLIITEKEVIS